MLLSLRDGFPALHKDGGGGGGGVEEYATSAILFLGRCKQNNSISQGEGQGKQHV